MNIENKIAVITGVSGGIGYHTAMQLLKKGARVFGLGRNTNDISHPQFTFIRCDVRHAEEVAQAFAKVYEQTNSAVHILLNNAGLGYFGFLEDMSIEQWKELYETNVNGLFYCC